MNPLAPTAPVLPGQMLLDTFQGDGGTRGLGHGENAVAGPPPGLVLILCQIHAALLVLPLLGICLLSKI